MFGTIIQQTEVFGLLLTDQSLRNIGDKGSESTEILEQWTGSYTSYTDISSCFWRLVENGVSFETTGYLTVFEKPHSKPTPYNLYDQTNFENYLMKHLLKRRLHLYNQIYVSKKCRIIENDKR